MPEDDRLPELPRETCDRAAVLHVEGRPPELPVEGRDPRFPVDGRPPRLPVDGREPRFPVEGLALPDPQPRASRVPGFAPLRCTRLWSGFHCCLPDPPRPELPILSFTRPVFRSVFLFRSIFRFTFRLLSMSTQPEPQLQWFHIAPQAIPQAKPTPNETSGAG